MSEFKIANAIDEQIAVLEEKIAKVEKHIESLTAFVADMQIDIRSSAQTDPVDYDDSLIK